MWFTNTLLSRSSGEMLCETVLPTIRTHSDPQDEPRRRRLAQRFLGATNEAGGAGRGSPGNRSNLSDFINCFDSQSGGSHGGHKGPLLPEPPLISPNLSWLLSCEPLSVWTVRRHERQSGRQKPFGGQNI